MDWRLLFVLFVACASQPRAREASPENTETTETAETAESAESLQSAESNAAPVSVAERDPLPEIGAVVRIEWPERFLGKTVSELIADQTLMALYRDDGHRALQLHLVPIDDTSGWVVDRGVVTSPDYSHALYERWSRVERRGDELLIRVQVGRSEASDARSEVHETRYDAIRAHHERCVDQCDDVRCQRPCTVAASRQMAVPHVLTLGDARVAIAAPRIRIEWAGHALALDDIEEINVLDHPTRPAPFFAHVRREPLDRDRDAIVIAYRHGCDEDAFCPSSRVFVHDTAIRELEGEHGRATDVELRGDGTLRFTGGDIRMCEPSRRQRARHRDSVEAQGVGGYDRDHYWWHQHRGIRRGTRVAADGTVSPIPDRAQPWGECTASFAAACPYVDIITEDGATRVGEILRWIRNDPATQGLALGRIDGTRLVVRLSEEKPETTYLDAVWLELDGERIDPFECAGLHCAADGRPHVMHRGDTLTLEFRVSPGREARLVATGYYVVDDY